MNIHQEAYRKFSEIFIDTSEIENMLEFILDGYGIEYNKSSFQDKIRKFANYLDSRQISVVGTRDKIFENKYSLLDAFGKIKHYRDVAAHEAIFLFSELSEVPKKMRINKFRRQYIGNINKLHTEFKKYSLLLYPLYEMAQEIGYNAFEIFDIDGTQIGDY